MTDAEESELLALQNQFLASNIRPAATAVRNTSRFKQARQADKDSDRFHVNLDSKIPSRPSFPSLIKDVVERDTPEDVQFTSLPGPTIEKLDWKTQNFEKQKSRVFEQPLTGIEEENLAKVRAMSTAELEAERAELLSSLTNEQLGLLQRKHDRDVMRSQVNDDQDNFGPTFTSYNASIPKVLSSGTSNGDTIPRQEHEARVPTSLTCSSRTSLKEVPDGNAAVTAENNNATIHFPSQALPELDPNSVTFFEDLKTKYFPDLEHDPTAMKWMLPPSTAEDLADYHESQEDLMPAQLRFDFNGNFVTPKDSREIDKSLGLHHHADAPLAAGYTIPELAHLCRSAHASQACMAIQTTGRILFKIGKSFYGRDVSLRLKDLVEKTKVEHTLLERARDRHLSISSYATEALWQANLGRQDNVVETV